MKAICKKPFATAGRDYKPGDEVEASEKTLKGWGWHGYVELPTTTEHVAETEKAGIKKPEKVVTKKISAKEAANRILEITGIKKKKKK